MVSIHHFSAAYGDVNVVEDFSLSAKVGEIHCIIGPGKSGKSTILKKLAEVSASQDFSSSGEIQVDSTSTVYVSQSAHTKYRNMNPDKVNYQLWKSNATRIQLSEVVEQPERSWAAPELKLLAITRALSELKTPGLVLLDEPEVKMDKYMDDLIHLLLTLRQHCVIIVTHRVDFMLQVADHITYLLYGKTIASQPKKDFVQSKDEDVQYLLRLGV